MKPTLSDYEQAGFHAGCAVAHTWKTITALARTNIGRVAFAVILVLLLFVSSGCNHTPRPIQPTVESAPILASQTGKDVTIISEAAKIDAIAPAAKPHTDAQRAAVAAAPAADVAKLSKDYEAKLKEQAERIADLTKLLEEARNQTDRTILVSGYALSALLVSLGVATFFLMAQLAFLGPRIGYALIGAGASVFAMLQAYQWTKAHPWVTGIALLFLAVAAALAAANHLHSKDKV